MDHSIRPQSVDREQRDDSMPEMLGNPGDPASTTPATGDPVGSEVPVPAGSDFSWAIDALVEQRDEILASWLTAASAQPFHETHPERTVSDDIPRLYDAVIDYLKFAGGSWRRPGSPIDQPGVLDAANSHARTRAEQGLQPSDVVTEFRLLRRAIWKGLHDQLGDLRPTGDVISAELLVNDAIDGAITVGLSALTSRVEEIREDFLVSTIHDIRQPITAIKGLAQLANRFVSRENPEIWRVRTTLADIASQVDKLNKTIDVLIDVSRAALGQLALQPLFVDLARLVPQTVEYDGVHRLRDCRITVPELGVATGYWDPERI